MLTVLLVCTGNICRSPLAEAFLADRAARALEGGVNVGSAGSWATPGSPATREAVMVARERDLDISDHRARRLTRELVEEADLVLGLADEHRDEILALVPEAADKTFTLKGLAGEEGDVRDPLGLGIEVYRDVAADISTAVDSIIQKLTADERARAG